MKRTPTKPVRKSRNAAVYRHLEIAAYSRRTEFLSYTITLPEVTEAWVRKLVKHPRGVIIGGFDLGAREIAAVQRIVEVKLEPKKFWYQFEGESFFVEKQAMAEYKRMKKAQKDQRIGT